MVVIILCLAFTVGGNTKTMAKSKVVKVKLRCLNSKKEYHFYGVIEGLDKNGKVIWKYNTPPEPGTEISTILCKTKGNSVYIVTTSGRFIRLNKNNGKKIYYKKKKVLNGATTLNVHKNGSCYISANRGNFLLKLSKKGKVIWKTSFKKTKYYWPYKVKMKKTTVQVWFEAPEEFKSIKMTISQKNGKILSVKES